MSTRVKNIAGLTLFGLLSFGIGAATMYAATPPKAEIIYAPTCEPI